MKKFNRTALFVVAMIATAVLFLFSEKVGAGEVIAANAGIIALTDAEKAGLNESELKFVSAVEKLVSQVNEKIDKKAVSKEEVQLLIAGVKDSLKNDELKRLNESLQKIKEAADKQGVSLATIENKIATSPGKGFKPINQVLQENKAELKRVYDQGSGVVKFMANINEKGEFVMRPYTEKVAGPHATIDDVGHGDHVSSVSHNISTAAIIRMGADAPIVSQYRNSPFLLDLLNVIPAGFDMPVATWFEEQARDGNPAETTEGGTKTTVQYKYQLKHSEYRKAAALVGISQEFNMDFARLESDIMGKGRLDVLQVMHDAILSRVNTAATAYNTASSFGSVTDANEFDVIAAMAAQVDNDTKGGGVANAAIMSTFKKYRMGVNKTSDKGYMNPPAILNNIALIGNSAMAADAIIVGDMKAYNVILRGGFIVKVGYNGTDFAENRYSVVMEQFYYDYIAAVRQAAIVKGPDFASVKSAIGS